MFKNIYILTVFLILVNINKANASGTYTVGSGQTYTTLKAAFDAINAGTISGTIVLQIAADCSEAATASLNASGVGSASYTTINIYPTGATRTISGALAASLITLEGADNVTIDGRLSGSGAANSLVIENTNTGTSSYTILFEADATSNIVKYCTIKGAGTSSSKGTIAFLTAASGGNDSNTISYNTITKSSTNYPANLLYSSGTAANTNSGITITNNDFVDFLQRAIYVSGESTTWTITNNSFYQSTSQTATNDMYFIHINTGSGYTITGNYLGGQAASCGGSAFTFSSAGYSYFGIYFGSSSSGGTTNTISSNTISNLNWTSTVAPNSNTVPIIGFICTNGSSNFTIGSSGNANTIGATSGTGNITLAVNGSTLTSYCSFAAVLANSSGTHNISYNTFGSINYSTSVNNNDDWLAMIWLKTTGTTTVSYNTIGNSTANNITITSKSQYLEAIYQGSQTINLTINNNTIQNFTINDAASGTYAAIYAMGINSLDATHSIYNNTISNLTNNTSSPSGSEYFHSGQSLTGMYLYGDATGGSINVYNNTISGFSHTYTGTTQVGVVGMRVQVEYNGTANVNVYNNLITTLANASNSASSSVVGLYIEYSAKGTALVYNNVILLSDAGNSVSKIFRGIMDYGTYGNAGLATTGVYHNTVKLYATYTSGTAASAALTTGTGNLETDGGTHYYKNNILQNLTTGGSGGHYSLRNSITPTYTNFRNNYHESATGIYAGAANRTLATWQGASYANTATEITGSISINSSTGAPSDNTTIGSTGTPIASVTTDYSGTARNGSTPSIGAYEMSAVTYIWDGSSSIDWKTAANWSGNTVPIASSAVTIPTSGSYTFAPTIDEADAVCGTLTIQSGGTLTASSGKLTITSLALNSGGTVSFGGGEIEMSGNLTWNGEITMTSGTLDVNGNITLSSTMTETISGGTIECAGNFSGSGDDGGFTPTGGSTTMDGSSSSIDLFSSANFHNLTIALSGTATLGSAIDINGALTISTGTLDVSGSNYGITCAGNFVNNSAFTYNAGTVTFDGTSTLSGSATTTFYDIILTGTLTGHSTNFNVARNWTNTAGTFTHNSGTVTFNGTTTLTSGGNGATKKFYNLVLNGTSVTLAGNIDIDNDFTLTSGTWSTSGSNYSINLGGDFIRNGGTFTINSSTTTLDGAGTQKIHVTSDGGTTPYDADITFYNIIVDATDAIGYYKSSTSRYFYINDLTINSSKKLSFVKF